MILRKPALLFLSLVITALVMALTLGVVAASSHVITGEYIDVGPDGYWDADVAPGGHQQWNFELAEPREHNILIEIEDPIGASLSVSIDGQALGTVSGERIFTLNLGAGSHAVKINNSGVVPVQYKFYMGNAIGGILRIDKDDGGVSVAPGGTISYTLTITDFSIVFGFITGLVLTEIVPDHTTFNPGLSDADWVCLPDLGPAGSACTIPISFLPGGGSIQRIFSVDVVSPLAQGVTQIDNTATLNPGNRSDSDSTPIKRPVGGTTTFLTGGSGSSAGSIALLAGGVAAAVAIAAGGWYTRRRWLGSRS